MENFKAGYNCAQAVLVIFAEELGMDKEMYAVAIPLGATVNMDGAAVVITIMTMTAANTIR